MYVKHYDETSHVLTLCTTGPVRQTYTLRACVDCQMCVYACVRVHIAFLQNGTKNNLTI